MEAFTLDTSGEIVLPYPHLHPEPRGYRWSDLSPFTQGYVEALFAGVLTEFRTRLGPDASAAFAGALLNPAEPNAALLEASAQYRTAVARQRAGGIYPTPILVSEPGFSDLAPETLATILKDCEVLSCDGLEHCDREDGDHSWKVRQAGRWPDFPPLTVTLNDAGKVVFA